LSSPTEIFTPSIVAIGFDRELSWQPMIVMIHKIQKKKEIHVFRPLERSTDGFFIKEDIRKIPPVTPIQNRGEQ